MPTPAIPLNQTTLFSEFASLDAGINDTNGPGNPYADQTIYSLLNDDDIFPMERFQTTADLSKGLEYLEENYAVTAAELKQYILQGLSRVIPWRPDTEYFASVRDINNNLVRGPDIVTHEGNIYIANMDFTSDGDFLEKSSPGSYNIFLTRIKLDTDTEYVEISATATSPLLVGDVIGRYVSMRHMTVYKEYTLPNAASAAESPNVEHEAMCNGNITTDCTIKIMCERFGTTPEHIGDITFTAPVGSFRTVQGVFTFNDNYSWPNTSTELSLGKGYMIYFEMENVPAELEWVAINMLAAAEVNYTHPNFTVTV